MADRDQYNDLQTYISEALRRLCGLIKVPEDSLSVKVTAPKKKDIPVPAGIGASPSGPPGCEIEILPAPRYTSPNGGHCPWLLSIARYTAYSYIVRSTVFSHIERKWLVYDLAGQDIEEPKDLAEYLYLVITDGLSGAFYNLLQLKTAWIDILSTMRYEGSPLTGKLVFAHGKLPENTASELIVPRIFVEKNNDSLTFSKDNLRHISKLLAGTGRDKNALFFCMEDGDRYRCVGYLPEEKAKFFPFQIEINGALNWSFKQFGKNEFRWLQGNPEVYEDHIMAASERLCQYFRLNVGAPGIFKKAIKAFAEQRHGTSAVFVDLDDKGSSVMRDRLENLYQKRRALKVEGLPLDRTEELTKLSRMDGAFVVDVGKREVIYLSVIVDGEAVVKGDNSRGARLNSLKNFIKDLRMQSKKQGKELRAAALIFSEDGSVDFISSKKGGKLRRSVGRFRLTNRGFLGNFS